jgi:glycosyltransferase involved in cell wall biosynthesis
MYRIGFDAKRLFNNFTGLGNYSRTLLRNLASYFPEEDYHLYTPGISRNEQTAYFQDSLMFNVHLPNRYQKVLWRSLRVKQALKRHKIDLYHGLSHEIPYGIPQTGIPAIVTIHDLIFRRYPDQYGWWDRKVYDAKFRYACENSAKIIAISESTKQDIIAYYNIDPNKIEVVYQSCHEGFMVQKTPKVREQLLKKYQLPTEYMLYVGSLIERKNLLGILDAMRQLPKDLQLPLVIVGQGQEYRRQVLAFAEAHDLLSLLYFIKPVFSELPALYQQSSLFLYPSYAEGFGIPILEALYSETPVVTSNVSSLPEAAGPGAYLVDPNDSSQIAEGISTLLTDTARRNTLIEAGFAHAKKFNGEDLTKQLMAVYKQILD